MRIPKINKYRLSPSTDTGELVVDIKPCEYYDDLGLFEDPKEFKRFIIRTKFYIRNTVEYKKLIKFLKKCRGMYHCGVHNNINMWDGFPIEVHHTPFVLEDIVYIVINKRKELCESLKMSDIAKEVMRLHYLGLIGLYPLCETCHEYAHGETNDLFIPLDAIFGEPAAFYEIYKDFITDTLQQKFENIQQINEGYNLIATDVPQNLVKKYIYVTTKGQEMMSTTALVNFIDKLSNTDCEDM